MCCGRLHGGRRPQLEPGSHPHRLRQPAGRCQRAAAVRTGAPLPGPGSRPGGRMRRCQAAVCALISLVLIAISCVLANWLLASEHRTLLAAFRAEFAANWLLLTFCLVGFAAIVHALRFFQQLRDYELASAAIAGAPGYADPNPRAHTRPDHPAGTGGRGLDRGAGKLPGAACRARRRI